MIAHAIPAIVQPAETRGQADVWPGSVVRRSARGDDAVHAARQQLAIFDALGTPAFACDDAGRVRAMNAGGQAMLGGILFLREGRLDIVDKGARGQLHQALAQRTGSPTHAIAIAAPGPGAEMIVLDVVVTSPHLALVLCRVPRGSAGQALHLLRTAFDLTHAEAEVALRMAHAERLQTIAGDRGVSEGTVRCQSKAIFAKLGVSTQAQLVHKMRAVTG